MDSGRKSVITGLIFLAFGLGIATFCFLRSRPSVSRHSSSTEASSTQKSAAVSKESGQNTDASTSGQEQATTSSGAAGRTDEKADPHFDYGKLPSVKGNANPQVQSVAEALRDKSHPERISPLIQAKFNADEFRKDRAKYAAEVQPGRCFVTAQPGSDTPRLARLSPELQTIKQGERVALRLQTAPNGCVSLTSFDGGTFSENGLNAISRLADDRGLVEVHFVGTGGTVNECKVLAGSPQASGTVRFLVNVLQP